MGKLGFSFQLQLSFTEPIRNHAFALRCLPDDLPGQRVLTSSLRVLPDCDIEITKDRFGLKQWGTAALPHAGFSVLAEGEVDIDPTADDAAGAAWQLAPYRRATHLTAPGPHLAALRENVCIHDPVHSIMELLHERFIYLPGSTQVTTTAEAAAKMMHGVCQDEAHIMLALLRTYGIPCRYVMGYMLGEGSTHAWVEALCDNKWIGLDPTNHRPVNEEYIRIAIGRDADDCFVNRGVFTGTALQRSQCCVSVWRVHDQKEEF